MTNRIADHLPPEPPPADGDDLAGKLRSLRALCLGVLLFEVALLLMASSVVVFALKGQPLVKIGGTQVLTGVGAVLTLTAVVVAVLVVPFLTRSGLKAVATPPPPPVDGELPETPTDRLWRVYAQGKFAEYGLTVGAALVTAVLFHLSADWLMLVFVAGMVAFQLVRFPTEGGVRKWLEAAAVEVDRFRSARSE